MFYYIYFLSYFLIFFYFYLFPGILEFWFLVTVTFKFTVCIIFAEKKNTLLKHLKRNHCLQPSFQYIGFVEALFTNKTFICSVLCISHVLLKKRLRKVIRRFLTL